MKQGLVDGQDNGFDAIAGAKYYEVQKYAMRIDYIQSGLIVLIAAGSVLFGTAILKNVRRFRRAGT